VITKKQKILRYIDKNYAPKNSTKKLVIFDKNGARHEIVLPKLELISRIIRNFNDLGIGVLYDGEAPIEISKYDLI
jgi:hypothetical protein